MKPVVELLAATAELEQAVAWYEQREPGLGERLYVVRNHELIALKWKDKK